MRIITAILGDKLHSPAFDEAGKDATYTTIYGMDGEPAVVAAVAADHSTAVIGLAYGYRLCTGDGAADDKLTRLLHAAGASDAELAGLGLPEFEGTRAFAAIDAELRALAADNGGYTHSSYTQNGHVWHTLYNELASIDIRLTWDYWDGRMTLEWYTSDCAEDGPYAWYTGSFDCREFVSDAFADEDNPYLALYDQLHDTVQNAAAGHEAPGLEVVAEDDWTGQNRYAIVGDAPMTVETFLAEMGW